jgi:endogenous inhibitor of DNA gyrase (YacG/DUF329 family)
MYCPNCGQQQISDEMRFCSRCGLAFSGLADWLAGSRLVAARADEAQTSLPSARRKGMRRAAKLIFFGAVLFPVFLIISLIEDEPGPLIAPFLVFFAGLAWMLYARLFADPTPVVNHQVTQTPRLAAPPVRGPLPPASTIPISDVRGSQVKTNELAQPPSVTENTTRFLDNE